MKPDKILFLDTETGGINPSENSLLSIAFVVWQGFKIIDSIEILINDEKYNVTPEAININRINLDEHKKVALSPDNVIIAIDTFLNNHFKKDEKITLAGHNINFDVNFLMHFLKEYQYNNLIRFSYRNIDTATILYYLYLAGKIKQKTISSQEAFDLFGVNTDKRHTALGDALATANLFTKLLKIITKNISSKPTTSVKLKTLFDL